MQLACVQKAIEDHKHMLKNTHRWCHSSVQVYLYWKGTPIQLTIVQHVPQTSVCTATADWMCKVLSTVPFTTGCSVMVSHAHLPSGTYSFLQKFLLSFTLQELLHRLSPLLPTSTLGLHMCSPLLWQLRPKQQNTQSHTTAILQHAVCSLQSDWIQLFGA